MTEGSGTTTAPRPEGKSGKGSLLSRVARYYREIVAELRKVIAPTRKELITYTTVVLVFVTVMVSIVYVLDTIFARVVLSVFG